MVLCLFTSMLPVCHLFKMVTEVCNLGNLSSVLHVAHVSVIFDGRVKTCHAR